MILDPYLESNQSQNLIYWFLAQGLSFHKIWFESVNNPDACPYSDADKSQNLTLSEGLPRLPLSNLIVHPKFLE